MQDALLEATRSASSFSGQCHIRTWLTGFVKNCVRRHHRGSMRRHNHAPGIDRVNDPFEPLLEDRVSQSRRVACALEQLSAESDAKVDDLPRPLP